MAAGVAVIVVPVHRAAVGVPAAAALPAGAAAVSVQGAAAVAAVVAAVAGAGLDDRLNHQIEHQRNQASARSLVSEQATPISIST